MSVLRFLSVFVVMFFLSCNSHSQKSEKSTSNESVKSISNEEVVKKFLNGFNDPSKIGESFDLLSNDYKFTNPMVKLESKEEFLELAQNMGKVLTGVKVIGVAPTGDWVGTYYEFTSSVDGLEKNIASEWFKVIDGRIVESHLVYDATHWRAVYEDGFKK